MLHRRGHDAAVVRAAAGGGDVPEELLQEPAGEADATSKCKHAGGVNDPASNSLYPKGPARLPLPGDGISAEIRNTHAWKSVNLARAVRISGDGGQEGMHLAKKKEK